MSAFGGKADMVRRYLNVRLLPRKALICLSIRSLLVGIAIMLAGATAVRAQTRDTVIFGLPIYNSDEAVKKQCEEAAPKPAVSKPACMAAGALQEKQSRDELAKIWNTT
jgi:hypothetical protein